MVSRLPVVLVLAAGGSTRLGRPKQFLRHRGATLLQATVASARRAGTGRPIVITGARRFAVALAARRAGARTLHNARWHRGMGTSLARGAGGRPRATALLVMTVDQPYVRARDLSRLLRAWRRRPQAAAAAAYGGRLGVPAILPRRHFGTLRRADNDSGARQLLNARTRRVTAVPMPAAALDIDTPEDWTACTRGWRPSRR